MKTHIRKIKWMRAALAVFTACGLMTRVQAQVYSTGVHTQTVNTSAFNPPGYYNNQYVNVPPVYPQNVYVQSAHTQNVNPAGFNSQYYHAPVMPSSYYNVPPVQGYYNQPYYYNNNSYYYHPY